MSHKCTDRENENKMFTKPTKFQFKIFFNFTTTMKDKLDTTQRTEFEYSMQYHL